MKTVISPTLKTSSFSEALHIKLYREVNIIFTTFNNCLMKTFIRKFGILAIAFVIGNLFFVINVAGQITQQQPWVKAYDQVSGTGTTTSFAITNGSNRILIVGVTASVTETTGSSTITNPTITYGAVPLTMATGDGTTNARMHTWLYYLKSNAVMDNTSRQLSVTISGTTLSNMTVYYSVFAGVNQIPSSYTVGNGLSNTSGSGPAQLSSPMTVGANEQAVYISSIYDRGATTIPGYTINTNWTSGGNNSGTNTSGGNTAWKSEVAKRTTIPATSTTDAAGTSAITPTGNIRWAMSAMSLPMAAPTLPTITTFLPTNACSSSGQSVTITGTNFTGATAVTFNGVSSTFIFNNATQITATLPAGATTGKIGVTTPSGSVLSSSNFTVFSPVATVSTHTNVSCYAGTDGTITILASDGTAPYQFSVDNGVTYTTGSNPNPYTYGGLSANVPYKIRIIDNNTCQSPAIN